MLRLTPNGLPVSRKPMPRCSTRRKTPRQIAESGPDRYTDPYETLAIRPNTRLEQLDTGIAALAAAERRIIGTNRAGVWETTSVLGSVISVESRANAGTSLVGKTVETAQDLAVLAQVVRDPRYETFRVFYVDDLPDLQRIFKARDKAWPVPSPGLYDRQMVISTLGLELPNSLLGFLSGGQVL